MDLLLENSAFTPEEVRTRIGFLSDERQSLLLSPSAPDRVLQVEEELDYWWDVRLLQESQEHPSRWQFVC